MDVKELVAKMTLEEKRDFVPDRISGIQKQ